MQCGCLFNKSIKKKVAHFVYFPKFLNYSIITQIHIICQFAKITLAFPNPKATFKTAIQLNFFYSWIFTFGVWFTHILSPTMYMQLLTIIHAQLILHIKKPPHSLCQLIPCIVQIIHLKLSSPGYLIKKDSSMLCFQVVGANNLLFSL